MIQSGHSALVLGETGSGIDEFSQAIYEQFYAELVCANAIYKGSLKQFFKSLAEQLDIPTETDDDRPKSLSAEQLREEILANANENWLFILPEAKRLTPGMCYWLEDIKDAGVRVVCFAAACPNRPFFLELLEVELDLPDDRTVRSVMEEEADRLGLTLSKSRLAELQPLAGRNPMIARKVIQREKLGMKQDKVEHTQYVVIMPVIIAALFSFAVVRFIGMGTGNKGLYIIGGICLVSAMALKQLGHVRGAKKRLGQ